MPLSDEEMAAFQGSNVVALPRAASASVEPQADAAGKAINLAPKVGMPASVIGADLETYQQAERGQKAAQAIQNNGWISDYIARNPTAAEVSSDDYDNLDKVSKAVQPFTIAGRSGGLLQAAPEFFLHSIPETYTLLSSPEGRAKIVNNFGKVLQALGAPLMLPGEALKDGFDIHDPADMERAQGLGLLIGLGKQSPKVEAFPRLGRSTPGEIDAFLHQAEGLKTRAEIDEFLAGKAAPGKDPKQVLQIEMAKADSAHMDEAISSAAESKTKTRAPSMLEDFIAGHDTDNIQLPAEAVADLYRAERKVPAKGDGLFGFVPGLSRDLALGVETGVEITVPAAKYIAHVDPAVHEKIKDLIRFRPEGVTQAEAAEMKPGEIEAYHGSPHTFDAFKTEAIGTGEGAQSYGHGLYFAKNPEVAKSYAVGRQDGTTRTVNVPDNPFSGTEIMHVVPPTMYKVSISANREHFLDWDKPLSEQPAGKTVLETMDKTFKEQLEDMLAEHDQPELAELKGGEFLQLLERWASEAEIPGIKTINPDNPHFRAEASKFIENLGIPGIKYLDQGSRIKSVGDAPKLLAERIKNRDELIKQGRELDPESYDTLLKELDNGISMLEGNIKDNKLSSNFVVFDPKSITILERNGERLRNEAVQEETELGLRPLFSEPPPDMTKPEFERYNKRIIEAQQAILDRATKQVESEKDARLTKEWKAQEAKVREEMTSTVAARPDVATEGFLKRGKLKLDTETVDAMLPDNVIPAALKTSGAAHPDDIAPFVGFDSGTDLVRGLNDLIAERKARGESPTKQIDRLISEATASAMETRHGDFGRQIAEEARALALDDIHFDLLSDELRTLARANGGTPPMSKADLKEWAAKEFIFLDTKKAANYQGFQKAAGRAGKETEKALLAGDSITAFKAKQMQVKAWLMAKEADKFAKEIEKIAGKIDRVQGAKEITSMDQGHFDQLRSMLASVGFGPKHPIPEGLKSLPDFVADSNGQLAVASWLQDGTVRLGDPSKLTAQQMRDLGKSIDSMMHVGRAVKTLDSARGKAELQNVVFDIKGELDRFNLIEQPLNPSVGQRAGSMVRWVNAWSLLVERMLDYTDKFDPNGPLTTYMDRPLRDSNVKEIQLNEKATRKLQALAKLTDNSINDIIPNHVIPSELNEFGFLDMTRRNLRQLMGYMGSESGAKKVTLGFGVAEADVWKLINENATKADWQWVAGMHDLFDDLWKESAAMQERDTGVVADPVQARPMKSEKHGDFPGGYWPIKYDRTRSNIEGHLAAKDDLFDKHYVQAVTPQGYTQSRTQYAAPLDLSGQLIGSHIRGVIHDIAFRESVRNAAKLINNAEFMAAMTQKWGKEYAGLLPGWIKDIANSHRVDDSYAMGAARWSSLIRQNITSTLIALNPGTVIKHGMSAMGMSVERVGAKELGSAAADIGLKGMMESAGDLIKGKGEPPTQERLDALRAVTDPSEIGDQIRQFIIDSSAVMRNRQRSASDNIREAYSQNIRSGTLQTFVNARNAWMDVGRFPVALSDAVSAMPTWLAAYKESMARGEDHAQAVFEADKQVTRAHGSSFIGDKARIMRTDETMRWVTPLYNFWNHMQNNYLQWMWDAGAWAKGREEPGANVASLSRRVFWLAIWSIAAEEIASPALDEDRRSLGQKVFLATLRHFGAGFIGVRDITNAAAHGYEPSVGLLGTLGKEIAGTGREMARVGAGKELSKNWLIHAFTALGFATGLGGAQLGKTSSYLKDRATGAERKPRSFSELRQGLRTGHSKPRIHQ